MAKHELNYRGLACPMPIVKISIEMKKAAPGDVFEAVSDEAGFEPDIIAWCRDTGNVLEGLTKSGKDITAIIIKK
jgi:TusA-related sulfurtransferase